VIVRRLFPLLVLFLVSSLLACTRIPGGTEDTGSESPTATRLFEPVSTATVQATTPVITSTPSPTPQPDPAVIEIADQVLVEDGLLTINRIESEIPGWVAIYNESAGEAADILGYVQVPAGRSDNVQVTINPYIASPTLYARFHRDEGQKDIFEFPGPDSPDQIGGDTAEEIFTVDIQIYQPRIIARDQNVGIDGVIVIESTTVAEPAWLVLYADDEGVPGSMLAYVPLKPGVHDDVTMAINWQSAPPMLHAILYNDAGDRNVFEAPEIDPPIIIDGESIATSFEAVYPPDIYVLNQPATGGEVIIERVISYGPGWLVIYNQNEEAALGNIIGSTLLNPGINSQVTVSVTESAVTPVLYAMLHEDVEELGEFGFPATDPVILFEDSIQPFDFRTDAGNYVMIRDQPLSARNTITISLAVVEEDAWAVIYNNNGGQPGEILGRRWLPAGINRDIEVTVDGEATTPEMFVVLHQDGGQTRIFDYPDGLDGPFQRGLSIIQAPFKLTGNGG